MSTQAGKGFFRRQEIQDLIALLRALADGRDTLALGALLRGPLVGLTEFELLDISDALPPDPDRPDRLPSTQSLDGSGADTSRTYSERRPNAPNSGEAGALHNALCSPLRCCCPPERSFAASSAL